MMDEMGIVELILASGGVFVILAIICCLCCVCMKCSDMKMRSYIIEMAKRKGVKVDLDQLDPKHPCQSPHANENCAIFVPDVGIIL